MAVVVRIVKGGQLESSSVEGEADHGRCYILLQSIVPCPSRRTVLFRRNYLSLGMRFSFVEPQLRMQRLLN